MLKSQRVFVFLMGGSSDHWFKIILLTNLGTLGLVGWEFQQQFLLRQQVQELRTLVAWSGSEVSKTSSGGGHPGPYPGGGAQFLPKTPEARAETLGGLNAASSSGLVTLSIGLIFCLVGLLLVGHWCYRRGGGAVDLARPSSPINKRDLAQRQLAEIRLRRHGFGK